MEIQNCKVKAFFDIQGRVQFFVLIPPKVYEDLVRMFYANLCSPKYDKIESLVLGQRIVLDYSTFDSIFQCQSSGYSAIFKNYWPKDFAV